MILSGYFGFFHHYNGSPWYSWNIAENGVKHNKSNQINQQLYLINKCKGSQYHKPFIYFTADLKEQRIYWTDNDYAHIMSAKVDGSEVEVITSGLSEPRGITVHDNDIYFSATQGGLYNLYKQSKSQGSSKIQIHSETPYIKDIHVFKGTVQC